MPFFACAVVLPLSGCAALGAVGGLLATPLSLLGGVASAIGRTVTAAEEPAAAPDSDPTAQRGAEIAARGTFRGDTIAPAANSTDNVAHR